MRLNKLLKLLFMLTALSLPAFFVQTYAAESSRAESFSDLPTGWSRQAMINAIDNGLMSGYNGKIMPKAYLTRAQLASITNKAFGVSGTSDISNYSDIQYSDWFYDDMAKAVSKGTMVGSNNRLYPNNYATREEVFTVLARSLDVAPADASILNQFSDKKDISIWAQRDIAAMVTKGYMFGSNGKLQPKTKITREEFAYVIDQFTDKSQTITPESGSGSNASSSNAATGNSYNAYPEQKSPPPFVPIEEAPAKTLPPQESSDADTDDNNILDNDLENNGATNNSTTDSNVGTLSNQVINGDFIINESTNGGDVTLDNVSVSGRIIINSNGSVDLKVLNGKANSVLVQSAGNGAMIEGSVGTVDVDCEAPVSLRKSTVDTLNVNAVGSYIEISNNSNISALNLREDSVYSQVSITGSSLTDSIKMLSSGSAITINGNGTHINNLDIDYGAAGAAVVVDGSATINNLNISAIDVTLSAQNGSVINNLTNQDSSVNTYIEIDKTSSITSIDDNGENTYIDNVAILVPDAPDAVAENVLPSIY